MHRIVSLAPSATAIVRALDAGDRLVGVTAHCEVEGVPRLGGWLNPDLDRLADLDPDLVLTNDHLQADLREELCDRGFTVAHAEPVTLDDVLTTFRTIGDAIGLSDRGQSLEARARDRIDRIRAGTPDGEDRPVVYCEEWGDPPMAAGNWVPEAVRVAGGRYPFVEPGERSREVERETVEATDPAVAIVHHCGAGEPSTQPLVEREWDLDATVHVIDDSLLNQPSPRLLDGIERLASIVSAV
ncbi:periplasmic binding protein [Halorhabdus tiamatea SARL4B]|uniref:Periplasmatic binding protein n=1 Tax=Halorhabdus tiamatea SARL4B TaxID=1033806 RepID=F7PGE1_9EURY|nr:helical backbone metal receptor [Halorhabdus tiamatea]ERJ04951.1 periplasmic binding protein [Halorhabdus tiamatea SARL4B]CCQ33830.1 periplasmatic binding protein [Halorhabdus tiamatea SARL4B]